MDIKYVNYLGLVVHTVILPTWAAWTGRAQVQGQPGVSTKVKVSLGETLSKNKNINIRELRCWPSPCLLQSFKYNMQQHKLFQQMVEVCIIFILQYPRRAAEKGKLEVLSAELKINKLYLLLCYTQTSFITKLEEGNTRLSCQGF